MNHRRACSAGSATGYLKVGSSRSSSRLHACLQDNLVIRSVPYNKGYSSLDWDVYFLVTLRTPDCVLVASPTSGVLRRDGGGAASPSLASSLSRPVPDGLPFRRGSPGLAHHRYLKAVGLVEAPCSLYKPGLAFPLISLGQSRLPVLSSLVELCCFGQGTSRI